MNTKNNYKSMLYTSPPTAQAATTAPNSPLWHLSSFFLLLPASQSTLYSIDMSSEQA